MVWKVSCLIKTANSFSTYHRDLKYERLQFYNLVRGLSNDRSGMVAGLGRGQRGARDLWIGKKW